MQVFLFLNKKILFLTKIPIFYQKFQRLPMFRFFYFSVAFSTVLYQHVATSGSVNSARPNFSIYIQHDTYVDIPQKNQCCDNKNKITFPTGLPRDLDFSLPFGPVTIKIWQIGLTVSFANPYFLQCFFQILFFSQVLSYIYIQIYQLCIDNWELERIRVRGRLLKDDYGERRLQLGLWIFSWG